MGVGRVVVRLVLVWLGVVESFVEVLVVLPWVWVFGLCRGPVDSLLWVVVRDVV